MMKRLLSICLLAMAFAAIVQAADGPKITFTKEAYDFGEVERGEKVSHEFEFKNTGDAELIISEVKPSCGCTTADMDKKNYQPGEIGKIPVTFDSSRFNGNINKTITVVSNDTANPRKQIKLSGKIIQEINITPNYLTLVNIKRSDDVERTIDISSDRLKKLEVTDVTSNVDFLKMETIRKDDQNVQIKVSFSASIIPTDKPTHTGFISFKTNSKSQPDSKVSVYVKVANPINASPRAVYLFASPKGKARDQVITLKNNGETPFKIVGIEDDLEHITVEKDGDDKLKVILSDKAESGKFAGVITVKTDLAEQPVISIPVRGNVI